MTRSFWGEKKTIIFSAFGLGALLGIGSALLYIKCKLEEHFRLHAAISQQVQELKRDLEKLKEESTVKEQRPLKSSLKQKRAPNAESAAAEGRKRRVSYKTSDEDEFLTASSDSSSYDDDAVIVFRNTARNRKDAGIQNLVPSEAGDQSNQSQDAQLQRFFATIDKLFEGNISDMHEAYVTLKTNKDKMKSNPEFWWRFAKATHAEATAAGQNQDKELQRSLLEHALSYAERALKLNDGSADAHKWFAVALGSQGDFLKTKEKIQNGFTFKQHIDRAITLKPDDSSLHHLLGRFCYEVSQLSWIERKVASTLFAAPPTATVQEALEHFLQSEKMGKSPFIENRVYIAKCYIGLGNLEQAAHWLNSAAELPVLTSNDKKAKQVVVELLPKYQKYLTS